MADYQFNTDLTPKIQGTNLGDMINMARGVQAYQQAEQANPLAIQRAKMEIEQAQKMNPLAVGKSTEELAQAQIGTKEKQFGLNSAQTSALYGLAGGVRNDPRLKTGKKEDAIGVLHEAKQRDYCSFFKTNAHTPQRGKPQSADVGGTGRMLPVRNCQIRGYAS